MTKPTLTQRVMNVAEFDEGKHDVRALQENARLRPLIEALAKCAEQLDWTRDINNSFSPALSELEKTLEEMEI